jgi:hypothetical protein
MTRALSPRLMLVAIVSLAAALLAGAVGLANAGRTLTIVDSVSRQQDLASLLERSAVVALVRPSGSSSAHWNSRDNKPWAANARSGGLPMIVTDESVAVERAWRGASAGDVVTVRTLGGVVGNHEFRDADSKALRQGAAYLVFLRLDDWAGRDVVDRQVLSPVGRAQGVFVIQGGRFVNSDGLSFTAKDLDKAFR